MSDERYIAGLLRVAREDLVGARLLASAKNRNAIYLCEQAAEKIIRAVVTSEQQHAGKGHQLDDMVAMIPDDNPLKPSLKAIEDLAAFATTYRYPTEVGRIKAHPTAEQFSEYATRVEEALNAAAKAFGVDLDDSTAPAAQRGPIR